MPSTRFLQLVGYGSYVLLGLDTVLVPSLIRSIESDFHQTDAAFGAVYLLRALSFALTALIGGLVMERIGGRVLLPLATLLMVVGIVTGAVSPWWALLVAGVVAASGGHGIVETGVNTVFLDLFPASRGSSLNILHLFFGIGALIGPLAIGALITAGTGWRAVLALTAALYLTLSVGFALARPSINPSLQATPQEASAAEGRGSRLPLLGLAIAVTCYVGAELGVSGWLVRYLATQSLVVATGALSAFWFGLSLGRLISGWIGDRWEHAIFTVWCVLLASVALGVAVLTPWIAGAYALYILAGMLYGPVYPMIMATGGAIYSHRTAALSGSITTAAAVGSMVYPPLMGVMAAGLGLRNAMLGAALLGVPATLGVLLARTTAYDVRGGPRRRRAG